MSAINRIILVGNGFDLAHSLATKYEDFMSWYWDKWFAELRLCHKNTYSDDLCTCTIYDKSSTWYSFLWSIINPLQPPKGRCFYEYLKKEKETCTINHSPFMERVCQSIETKGWVDIENEYYRALNNEYFNRPKKLNKEFDIIKLNLIEYLTFIQKTEINESIVSQNLKKKMLAPIKEKEIAISARSQLIDFIRNRYFGDNDLWDITISERLGWDKEEENIQAIRKFSKDWGEQITNLGIESVIDNNVIPEVMLYPNRLMLLNFNYTNTADLYIPRGNDYEYWFPINHIHGELKGNSNIIFGYGDEFDDKYNNIVKLNNNEHLRNIKSIRYLESSNYRTMLSFIESAPYQIYIMGHSCGNSDRTLLNTLFEHKNCVSIKPFYHQKEDGSDNYLDIIQNISRNFTNMKFMRDRVVNKAFCELLSQRHSNLFKTI